MMPRRAAPRAMSACLSALQSGDEQTMPGNRHDDPRANDDLAERLARCYTGAVHDVLRARGLANFVLPPSIVPLDLTMVAAGPVFTVRGRPDASASPHETLLRWTELLSRAPKGHVVMVQGNDSERALMGELSAETLQFRGVRGYVVDGGCRDTAFIRRIGFPVFCDKATPLDIVGAWVPVAYDEPISFGQAVVHPGDHVLADCDGIVVIPGVIANEVVAAAEAAIETEDKVRAAILSGVDPQQAYLEHGKF